MFHSLSKDELLQLVEYAVTDSPIGDPSLLARVEEAGNWQDELGINTYLLSQILDRKNSDGVECKIIIDAIYAMPDRMLVSIQELDYAFITFMLSHMRNAFTCSLEQQLVELLSDLGQYNYEKAIRPRYE